jgi:membrane protein YdbS with pleckstrin-like domain
VATLVLAVVGTVGVVPAIVRWEHFLNEFNASSSGADNGQPVRAPVFPWRRNVRPQTAAQTQTPV